MKPTKTTYFVTQQELEAQWPDILDVAAKETVTVYQGKDPWLCLVPHEEMMARIAPLLALIPDAHPLVALCHHVEAMLERECRLFGEMDESGYTWTDPDVADRVLALRLAVLQVVYGVRSVEQIYHRASFHVVYRWFLGEHYLAMSLPPLEQFSQRMPELQDDPAMGDRLASLVSLAASIPGGREEFQIDYGLLQGWRQSAPPLAASAH